MYPEPNAYYILFGDFVFLTWRRIHSLKIATTLIMTMPLDYNMENTKDLKLAVLIDAIQM